jgi:hypothetical protein
MADSGAGGRHAALGDPNDRLLLLKMMIKCADLSHPARPWEIHLRWTGAAPHGCGTASWRTVAWRTPRRRRCCCAAVADLVSEEFYLQGDKCALPLRPRPFDADWRPLGLVACVRRACREVALGLPMSAFMNRAKHSALANQQVGACTPKRSAARTSALTDERRSVASAELLPVPGDAHVVGVRGRVPVQRRADEAMHGPPA